MITAVPGKDKMDTKFAFEYYTDGTPYVWYERWYYKFFVKPENGQKMMLFVAVCAGLLILLFCCCLCICCNMCYKRMKYGKVDPK